MKRLMQGIRTWAVNFDLTTDAFYIEEDREPVEGKVDGERRAVVLIVLSAFAVWGAAAAVLWP